VSSSQRAAADDRALYWDGCLNVRELGGLPIDGDGQTSWKAVLRADSIRKLSDSGWEQLLGYGVSRIVDLRFHSELADDPPRDLRIDVVHIPVLPELDSKHWEEIDPLGDAAPDAASGNRVVYLEFLKRFPRRFVEAVEAVVTAPEGAVVIHCVGGKDRTGLLSALLLRTAGVSITDIAADYALSEVNLRSEAEQWIALAGSEFERNQRTRRSQTPAETMVGVLEELEQRYGSVESYLRSGGATTETFRRIRERLAGSASSRGDRSTGRQ
jgi:protein tyrosine/serine phosphatase